jgi:nitrate/TMAO reductase-like tetraheme cytochrome c subunit
MFKFFEKWSAKTKRNLAIALAVMILIAGVVNYKFYRYTQDDPNFCVSCHLMKNAFDAWSMSSHKGVNCHDCHHLAPVEMVGLMHSFIFKNLSAVPARHGKIIVGTHVCEKCHVDREEKFPTAPSITDNPFHEKHAGFKKRECVECHGKIIHKFEPIVTLCANCHGDKKKCAGDSKCQMMEHVPCLDCHNVKSLKIAQPDREKCLSCHGDDATRAKINATRKDISRTYPPEVAMVNAATRIKFTDKSPMLWACANCHKPHTQLKLTQKDCENCHKDIAKKGKHGLHFGMGMNKCLECHKPHTWEVQPDILNSKKCTQCHPAVTDPEKFVK